MHSLRRLTQAVVVRHPTVAAVIRPIVVPNATTAASSGPQMSPLSHYSFSPLPGRHFASLSGKEHSDSMEPENTMQKHKRSAADAQAAANQASDTQPLRPFGSNSEEIVAGDRSSIDPLSEVKAKKKGKSANKQLDQDISDQSSISGDGVSVSMRSNTGQRSASDRSGAKERSPSLTEVDEDEQAEAAKEGNYSGPNYNK